MVKKDVLRGTPISRNHQIVVLKDCQVTEVLALCACVDAYVALEDVAASTGDHVNSKSLSGHRMNILLVVQTSWFDG